MMGGWVCVYVLLALIRDSYHCHRFQQKWTIHRGIRRKSGSPPRADADTAANQVRSLVSSTTTTSSTTTITSITTSTSTTLSLQQQLHNTTQNNVNHNGHNGVAFEQSQPTAIS